MKGWKRRCASTAIRSMELPIKPASPLPTLVGSANGVPLPAVQEGSPPARSDEVVCEVIRLSLFPEQIDYSPLSRLSHALNGGAGTLFLTSPQ
jgi:hypothetical protein